MKAEIKSMKSDNPEVLSEHGLYPIDILLKMADAYVDNQSSICFFLPL